MIAGRGGFNFGRSVSRLIMTAIAGYLVATAATRAMAEPSAYQVTPQLIDEARREGKVTLYTSMDVQLIDKVAKAFEAAYPGIKVQIERSGAERLFQRIEQERGSRIAIADVVESTDPVHYVVWKRNGWLRAGLPSEVVEKWPTNRRDADGVSAVFRLSVSPIGYNTKYIPAEQAPKGFADLLAPKWSGKIVKSHPAYAGITNAATFQLSRLLGWDYFEKLARQKVMHVQSATETPRKIALGERLILADCSEYVLIGLKASGSPVEVVYPLEGTPTSEGNLAVLGDAPHPNAARLLMAYMFSLPAQQIIVETGLLRGLHPDVRLPDVMRPLAEIKTLTSDPREMEKAYEDVRRRYSELFGI